MPLEPFKSSRPLSLGVELELQILDAYDYYTSAEGGAKGAVMLGDEMIDEASRKMALVVSAKGRAAGMQRTKAFEKPEA